MIIGICGVGNFGYAILKHLDKKYPDSRVTLKAYDYDKSVVEALQKNRTHPFLFKDVKLSKHVEFVESYEFATDCDIIVLAVPSNATRPALQGLKPFLKKHVKLVNTAKALDYETGKRLSEIIQEELGEFEYTYAVLSGGTIAKDLFAHEPLGVDIACDSAQTASELAEVFSAENLYVNISDDVVGTELAGAFKNVISLLAGLVKGFGLSYGSETHIISVTAQAIADVCVSSYGADPKTFSIGSQCWGNDMWMSATGNTRNRQFGELLGKGLSIDEAYQTMGSKHKTVEALNTLQALEHFPKIRSAVPAVNELVAFLDGEKTAEQLRATLFSTR